MGSWGAWQSFISPSKGYEGSPATDIVKSLIGLQERREEKDRLKRAEERLNAQLAMQQEQDRRAAEEQQFERELGRFEFEKTLAGNIEKDKKITEEILKNVMNPQVAEAPEIPPAEREKVTQKVGADGSETVSVDRPLPVDQSLGVPIDTNPEVARQLHPERFAMPEGIEMGGGPDSTQIEANAPFTTQREILERLVPNERRYAKNPYTGEDVPLEFLEERLARESKSSMVSPQVISAITRASRPLSQILPLRIDAGDRIEIRDPETLEVLDTIPKGLSPSSQSASKDRDLKETAVTSNGQDMKALFDSSTGAYYDPNTMERLTDIQLPPTAEMRNKKAARSLVSNSINPIKELSKTIITKVGPEQRADAIRRGALAVFGNDPQFRTYIDAKRALAGNLAVAQQGSRPSDADIEAIWVPLIPDPYTDTVESMNLKWTLVEKMSLPDASPGEAEVWERGPDGKPRKKQ